MYRIIATGNSVACVGTVRKSVLSQVSLLVLLSNGNQKHICLCALLEQFKHLKDGHG